MAGLRLTPDEFLRETCPTWRHPECIGGQGFNADVEIERTTDEIRHLKACINDLASVLTLEPSIPKASSYELGVIVAEGDL